MGILKEFQSVCSPSLKWNIIHPNEAGDWINQRNPLFATYYPLGEKKGEEADAAWFMPCYSLGLATHRDFWCYNSSKSHLAERIQESIAFYNSQVEEYAKVKEANPKLEAEDFITYDSTKFVWSLPQLKNLKNLQRYSLSWSSSSSYYISLYRPFFKQHVYFNRQLNDAVYFI